MNSDPISLANISKEDNKTKISDDNNIQKKLDFIWSYGYVKKAEQFIELHPNVMEMPNVKKNAFTLACLFENLEMAQWIIQRFDLSHCIVSVICDFKNTKKPFGNY